MNVLFRHTVSEGRSNATAPSENGDHQRPCVRDARGTAVCLQSVGRPGPVTPTPGQGQNVPLVKNGTHTGSQVWPVAPGSMSPPAGSASTPLVGTAPRPANWRRHWPTERRQRHCSGSKLNQRQAHWRLPSVPPAATGLPAAMPQSPAPAMPQPAGTIATTHYAAPAQIDALPAVTPTAYQSGAPVLDPNQPGNLDRKIDPGNLGQSFDSSRSPVLDPNQAGNLDLRLDAVERRLQAAGSPKRTSCRSFA